MSGSGQDAGRAKQSTDRPTEKMGRTVLVPVDILHRLEPAAAARGISVNRLCREILDAVGSEGMVDAVLDDQ